MLPPPSPPLSFTLSTNEPVSQPPSPLDLLVPSALLLAPRTSSPAISRLTPPSVPVRRSPPSQIPATLQTPEPTPVKEYRSQMVQTVYLQPPITVHCETQFAHGLSNRVEIAEGRIDPDLTPWAENVMGETEDEESDEERKKA